MTHMISDGGQTVTAGDDIRVAESLKSGEIALESFKPDLAVLDYFLRDGRGIDLIAAIHQANPRAKIYVMSGTGSAVELEGNNVDGFLPKPFGKGEVDAIIAKVRQSLEQGQPTPPPPEAPPEQPPHMD